MLVKEYRICMPLTVEEYRVGQLYMISKHSHEQSDHGGGRKMTRRVVMCLGHLIRQRKTSTSRNISQSLVIRAAAKASIPEGFSSRSTERRRGRETEAGGETSTMAGDKLCDYFPQTEVVTFDQANPSAILAKINDLNKKVPQLLRASDSDLRDLLSLMERATNPGREDAVTETQIDALELLLSWPDEFLFPALDILRLCLRLDVPNKHFLGAACGPAQLSRLLALTSAPTATGGAATAAPMLALRALCNACSRDPGRRLMRERRSRVVEGALELVGSDNRNVQIALATLLLNYAVLHSQPSSSSFSAIFASRNDDDDDEAAMTQLLSAAVALLERQPDVEASFRLLVCVATLVLRRGRGEGGGDAARRLSDALGVRAHAERCASLPGAPAKLTECARSLLAFL